MSCNLICMLTRNLKPQRKSVCESWISDHKATEINSYNNLNIERVWLHKIHKSLGKIKKNKKLFIDTNFKKYAEKCNSITRWWNRVFSRTINWMYSYYKLSHIHTQKCVTAYTCVQMTERYFLLHFLCYLFHGWEHCRHISNDVCVLIQKLIRILIHMRVYCILCNMFLQPYIFH